MTMYEELKETRKTMYEQKQNTNIKLKCKKKSIKISEAKKYNNKCFISNKLELAEEKNQQA